MWEFKGEYTGGAKAYLQEKVKKELKIVILSIIASVIVYIPFIIYVSGEYTDVALIASFSVLFFVTVALALLYQFYYKKKLRSPKAAIKITNDGVEFLDNGFNSSIPFYKLTPIEYRDDFVLLPKKIVLQKDVLIEGDWEELMAFLKKIEESEERGEEIFQINETEPEFFNATVKSKRIYERFVNGVSWTTPVGVFEYYVTFELENGEEMEHKISQELYEIFNEGQTGTLVLFNGNFFSFGDGEDVE